MRRRASPSGKQLCKAAERRGWILAREGDGVRVYRSPANPKLLVFLEYTGWPLPEKRARSLMRVLGLTARDFKHR